MKKIKRNSKIILAFILGIILTGTGVYATTTIMGSNVTYSNTESGLSSTNVQGVIDELYSKAENLGKVRYAYGDPDKVTSYTDYMELVSGYNKRIFIAKDGTQKLVCVYTDKLSCLNPRYLSSERENAKILFECGETEEGERFKL